MTVMAHVSRRGKVLGWIICILKLDLFCVYDIINLAINRVTIPAEVVDLFMEAYGHATDWILVANPRFLGKHPVRYNFRLDGKYSIKHLRVDLNYLLQRLQGRSVLDS